MSVRPSAWRSSRSPPSSTSWALFNRYRSRWNRGRRPACAAIRMKLGDATTVVVPRPAPTPFARTVFPAPRSPQRQMRSPGSATSASRSPSAAVAAGLSVSIRSSVGARVAIRPSVPEAGEPLEVAQRDGKRGSLAEADEAGLERHAGRKSTGTCQAEPGALGAGEGPGANPDEARTRLREIEFGVADDEARWRPDDRHDASLERLVEGH